MTVRFADGAEVVVVSSPDVEIAPTPAVAVTLAVLLVVSVVVALPFASVVAIDALREPLSVVNVTGTPAITVPLASLTVAVIAEWPAGKIEAGSAVIAMLATPAAPTAIVIAPVSPVFTPPERGVIVAVPDSVPALNITITRPFSSVSASTG